VSDFSPQGKGDLDLKVFLPRSVIAPNQYSFILALFEPGGKIYDIIENICPIKIVDTGTNFSVFEGLDYGSFIVDAKWQLDEKGVAKYS
jgi:lipopolysaccharide transport system ATP-binding protein